MGDVDTSYELDEDTELTPEPAAGEDPHRRFSCTLTDRWSIARGPNGGYIGALLARASLAASEHEDPLVMSTSYLARPGYGPAVVETELLHRGRSHSTVEVRLLQAPEGDSARAMRTLAVATTTLGTLGDPGPLDFQTGVGATGGPDEAVLARRQLDRPAPLLDRLVYRVADPEGRFFPEPDPAPAVVEGWVMLADGRPADAIAVPLFMDCWPPAVFGQIGFGSGGGVPTIELNVQWRGRPGKGWHFARLRTRSLGGRYLEEDGELWSEDGRLVAISRRLALFVDGYHAS